MRIRKNTNPKKINKMLANGETPEQIIESENNDYSVNQVVNKIDNPEVKAKIAKKYLNQIIKEDDVRNVLQQLPRDVVLWIIDNKSDILAKNGKLGYALQAIPDNVTKLDKLEKHTNLLMDLEVRDVILSLKKQRNPEEFKKTENKKIQIIVTKMFENIKQFGTTMHLREMLSCLKENSKNDLVTVCLSTFKAKQRTSIINSDVKLHIVRDFKLIDEKLDLNSFERQGLLTKEEINIIDNDIIRIFNKKDSKKMR